MSKEKKIDLRELARLKAKGELGEKKEKKGKKKEEKQNQ